MIEVSCTAALHHGTGRRGSALLLLSFVRPKSQFLSYPRIARQRSIRDGVMFPPSWKNVVERISVVHKGTKLTDPHGGDAWHPVPPTANKERLWNTEDLKCISKIFPACPVSGPRVANLLRTPSLTATRSASPSIPYREARFSVRTLP